MYWRSHIREDDGLTPGGGLVKPRPQQCPSTYDGKLACYEGDPVYCNTCKSWGVTKCVPPYRPDTDPEGRQANLDGDLCLCKCPIPPRLKASFDNVCMEFSEHALLGMAGVSEWMSYAGITPQSSKWIAFQANTNGLYFGLDCIATMDDGSILRGSFGDSNKVMFLSVSGAQCVKVEIDMCDTEHAGGKSIASSLIQKITG